MRRRLGGKREGFVGREVQDIKSIGIRRVNGEESASLSRAIGTYRQSFRDKEVSAECSKAYPRPRRPRPPPRPPPRPRPPLPLDGRLPREPLLPMFRRSTPCLKAPLSSRRPGSRSRAASASARRFRASWWMSSMPEAMPSSSARAERSDRFRAMPGRAERGNRCMVDDAAEAD